MLSFLYYKTVCRPLTDHLILLLREYRARGRGVRIKGAGEAFAWLRSTCSPSPRLTAHLPLANLAHTPADVV